MLKTTFSKHIALLVFLFFLIVNTAWASHIMGGNITYECMGSGNYVFQLIVYRDCNGAQVNTNSVQLRLWNHTVTSTITANYISTEDVSPQGQSITNGPTCFDCNTPNGNIGIGSIEKITYRSNPINLSGVPPTQGWVITYDDFSRNGNITNLQNPLNHGITLTAKIYNVDALPNSCNDNSPKFLQAPHFVSCVGKPFKMNLNPIDPDLDSLAISFDQPLNNLNNQPYSEGVVPSIVPFATGFSVNSPTPDATMAPGSVSAQIDPISGEITFLSNISGNFVIKMKVKSFRNGKLISEVVNEMQIIVTTCSGNNNPPIINGPFGGAFSTTVNAGDLVNFSFSSTDLELLQNNTPQSNTIIPTGMLFGPNPTMATGCSTGPCPTVSSAPAIGTQGASLNFSWQTDCAHLLDANGNELDMIPYQFVFRVQDNYCPIPEVIYETVTINVFNPGVIQAPQIQCIQGDENGNFTITWSQVNNPTNTFVEYRLYSVQNGLLTTIPAIGTTSFAHTGVTGQNDYYLTVVSGCNGLALRNSDTVSGIFLDLSNLNPGIAALSWNAPNDQLPVGADNQYNIYREYPSGTWTLINSTIFPIENYNQIIDICDQYLSYMITIDYPNCQFKSQVSGAQFTDQTPPSIPEVINVTIDTLTHQTTINWTATPEPDTYGYIVYMQDPVTNFLIELDTIYGQFNTSYTYFESYQEGAVTYTVAAFDSCPSPFGAPFNLSARDPNFHTTIYLESDFNICDGKINLTWSPYGGWQAESYDVFVKSTDTGWTIKHSTSSTSYQFDGLPNENYQIVIRANSEDGVISFSNVDFVEMLSANQTKFSYLTFATVEFGDETVQIEYVFDENSIVTKAALQRMKNGIYETIQTVDNPTSPTIFIDEDVYVDADSYTYRVLFYDSCGNAGYASNIGKTILLQTQIDNVSQKAYLNWTPYQQFNGSVIRYSIYRGIDGVYDANPLALLPIHQFSYEDTLYNIENNGMVCYRIEAMEGPNIFSDPKNSWSNESCVIVEPEIYVPNAFYPDGINKIFIPVLRNHDVSKYRFTVLNRWGQVVFMTTDTTEGWNGLINNDGPPAENTTYVYTIELYNGFGEQVMTRGHVTLLR